MAEKVNRRSFLQRLGGAPIIAPAAVGLAASAVWVPEAQAGQEVDRLFFFTHGTSVQVQSPQLASVARYGWGTVVSQAPSADPDPLGVDNWFHFAIPTPRSVNEIPFTCNRIWLDAKVDQFTVINRVHVWDTANQIKQFNDLSYVGRDQWYQFDVQPFTVVALGVSVGVKWIGLGQVLFRNAGAWFECPQC